MSKRYLWTLGLACILTTLISFTAWAVPGRMSYQGQLTDTTGNPVPDGDYEMSFALYDAPTGGTALWSEAQTVTVINGIYTVILGQPENELDPADFVGDLYLGVTVAPDSEMTPRQPLTSVGYALRAQVANMVANGAVTTMMLQDAAVDTTKLADNAITESKLGDATVTPAKIQDGATLSEISDDDGAGSGLDADMVDGQHGSYYLNWNNLTNVPAGFADGVDNNSGGDITSVSAGTGLNGGGASGSVTLNVDVPLALSGSSSGGVVSATNSYASGGSGVYGFASATTGSNSGVYGRTASTSGKGVYGYATATTGTTYGLRGDTVSTSGRGVYGLASAASGETYGVYGLSSSSDGRGVYGEASGSEGTGVSGLAAGSEGTGVSGLASDTGDFINYGGYFIAASTYGRGVYGSALGSESRGVYGRSLGSEGTGVYGLASGSSARGVYGEASYTGAYENVGGYFLAQGALGKGVSGEATNTGDFKNYGGFFKAAGSDGRGVYGYASNAGNVENYGGFFLAHGLRGRGVFGEATFGDNGIGVWGQAPGINATGVWGYGGKWDFYANGPGTNYGPFTGAHEVRLAQGFPDEVKPGMIVSVTGRAEKREKDDGQISLSSTLPTVTLTRKAMDKAVLGVLVSKNPLPRDHWYEWVEGERFGVVNSLGEGRVLVSNITGSIEAGDYITSSAIPGYGQKQDDDLLHSSTLGKAIETVDWESVTETIEYNGVLHKVYLIAVVYTSG